MSRHNTQPRKRRRLAFSCVDCRRRKIKCDRNDPCRHCVSAKLQCVYKTYPNEHTRRVVETGSSPDDARDTDYSSAIERQRSGVPTGGEQDTRQLIAKLLERVEKLEKNAAQNPGNDSNRGIYRRKAAAYDAQMTMDKTRVLRWSHWMGAGEAFEAIFDCYQRVNDPAGQLPHSDVKVQTALNEASSLLTKCKQLAKSSKVGRPSRLLDGANYSFVPPDRAMADMMSSLYFESFESVHRILHMPTFWKDYQKFWENPEAAKADTRLMTLLVISIGSSLYEHVDAAAEKQSIAMVQHWIYTAQAWLAGPLEKDRVGLSGLQIYCLTILARQIFSIGGDLVWMSAGSLIHRAMQMGLHCDPKNFRGMGVFAAELRRRLWATILELTAQSALDTSMPARMSLDEFDTEAPANINDGDMCESTTSLTPYPEGTYTETTAQRAILKSLPVRLRILQFLNAIKQDLTYPTALELSSELCKTHQQSMAPFRAKSGSQMPVFHRNLLDFHFQRFLILLHCPFACEAHDNPAFQHSLQTCTDAGLAILSPEPDAKFERLMAFGGGMFREGIRSANTAISLHAIIETETHAQRGTLRRASQYRRVLKSAVEDMVALSAKRIQKGETNVKSYMFLSMALAQMDATENGDEREVKIAEAAKGSLAYCFEMLQDLLGGLPSSCSSDVGTTPLMDDDGQMFFGLDFGADFFFSDSGFSKMLN